MAQKISVIFLISLLIELMMISKSTSVPNLWGNVCSNTTMFENNTRYQANLNTVFRFLSLNATNPNGFHQAVSSDGNTTDDAVYGIFLCLGNQNVSSCEDCVTTAISDLSETYCPNRKDAIIWYDECLLRYSNQSFFGIRYDFPRLTLYNTRNISNTHNSSDSSFRALLNNMLSDIAVRAANGDSQMKFATAIVNYTSFHSIYGLGQCTPDLSSSDCNLCLDENGVGQFTESQGGRIMKPSCVVRYEIYPFFQSTSPPLSPQLEPASNSTDFNGTFRSFSLQKLIFFHD